MSNENDRVREFISSSIDLEKFLDEAKQLKERITSFQSAHPVDESTLDPLLALAKTLSDYHHLEPAANDDDDDDGQQQSEDEASTTWRIRRKKTKLDAGISKHLKSYPACIEYLYKEFSQSRPHASHDTAFLKNIRECNQAASNIADDRLVLNLQIFFPIESRDRYRHQLMNELICLSTLTLAQIRDAIECVGDEQILGEYSEQPETIKTAGKRAGDENTAACFIIESVIYDDLRRTDVRLSEKILEQASSAGNHTQGTPMATTSLNDLKAVQLGKPYIYLHQNNCEHVIVFSELKLLEQDQCHDARFVFSLACRFSSTHCLVCTRCAE